MKRIIYFIIALSIFTLGAQTRDFPRPWIPVIYTNSTVAYCNVSIDGEFASSEDEVGAFVENECRGLADVIVNENSSVATLNIQGNSPETVNFAVWDASEDLVCSVEFTTTSNPGYDIGYPPNLLPIFALSDPNSNLPPVSTLPDSIEFYEDSECVIDLDSYFSDPEGESLNYNCSASGELSVSIYQGILSITTPSNYFGVNTIVISASDSENTISDTTVIDILPVNDPPFVFVTDDFDFEEDGQLVIDLSQYATDLDNDSLYYSISNNYNVLASIENSSLTLSASPDWFGIENLVLSVSDGELSDQDNFTVTVNPVNDPPAFDLPVQIDFAEDAFSSIELLNYAYDVDGDELDFNISGSSEQLTALITGTTLEINSDENWNGYGFIALEVSDPSNSSDQDSLSVYVYPVNDAPQINLPEEFSFDEDSETTIDFEPYVSDIDNDTLTLVVNGNINVQVEINELDVTFTAAENWNGNEVIQFTVNDGYSRAVASQSTIVNFLPVNDAPQIALPQSFSFYEYNQLQVNFSQYCYDVDNDDLSLQVSGNEFINVTINDLSVTFFEDSGWTGSEIIYFTVDDGELSSIDSVQVEVLENDELPAIILPEMITVSEDILEVIDFSNYIYNDEGYDLELIESGNQEIVIIIDGFSVSISAAENWNGEEAVTFSLMENDTVVAADSTIIHVAAVNDAPQLTLPDSVNFLEDSFFSLDCEPYIFDPDNTEFSLSCSGTDNILTTVAGLEIDFQPETNFFGYESLNITVNDNSGRAIASDSLIIYVIPVNDPPVVNFPQNIVYSEDTVYQIDFNNYSSDIDDLILNYSAETDFNAELSWQNEILTIIAPPNYHGMGMLYVSVSDSEFTVFDSVTVQINPVNDPPVIELPDNFTFDEDTSFSFDLNEYANDVDGDNLYITYSVPFFIFVELNGSVFNLESLTNWNGQANLSISVNDGEYTSTDEVELIINPINDPPVLSSFQPEDISMIFYEETTVNFSVNVFDNDSDLLFEWYVNSELLDEASSHLSYDFAEAGVYGILVQISDEEYAVQQEWQVEIFSGPGWQPVIYTNSTVCYGLVTLDNEPAGENDLIGAFVNDECRGIGEIFIVDGVSYTSFLIQGISVETVNFMLYSAEDEEIFIIPYTVQSNPGGDIGYPPNFLPLAAYTQNGPGWTPSQNYQQYTSVHLNVTIDDQLADENDVIAAFSNENECLGVGEIQLVNDIAYSSFSVWQDDVTEFSFKIWNADLNQIYSDYNIYYTDPGNQIGEPGNEVPVNFSSVPSPGWNPVVYTNSTTAYCQLSLDNENLAEDDIIGVFVENECRGVGEIFFYEGFSYSTIGIQGVSVETCSFRLWDASSQTIYYSDYTVETNPGGDIGYPPDELMIDFWSVELPELQAFPRPWNVVYYTNSTVAYGVISVDDQPVAAGNEVAAFINGECRGIALTVNNNDQSIFTMNIQGDVPEPVQFNYYDINQQQIYSIDYITITAPGDDIGYPPNMLPLAIYTNFPPVVMLPDTLSFNEDEIAEQDLSEFITDPDGDQLTVTVSGNENVNIEINGLFVTAWGNENWFGYETVDYSVDDGHGHIVSGDIVLEVLPVNDPPEVSLPFSFTIQEDQSLQIDFAIFITDVENDPWTLSVAGQEFLYVDIDESLVTLTPAENWNGDELLTFTADDGEAAGSDSIHIIVNPVNDAPIVDFPDILFVNENDFIALNYFDHIVDPDGDDFDVYSDGSEHIDVNIEGDSLFIIPDTDWYGTETITINANDNITRLIGSDDVEIEVVFVHQPPELELPEQFMIYEDTTETFDLSEYFTIYEGEDFEFSVSGNENTILAFDEDMLTISAADNWFGTETVVITLDDEPLRLTVSDTVNIVVTGVNDEPVIAGFYPEETELEIAIDSTISFSVDIDDIEGGIGYSWYLNSIEQPVFDSLFTYTFEETGEFEVQCMAFDEGEELYITWNLTVIEVNNTQNLISGIQLIGNYPNPFNPETKIMLNLTESNLPAQLYIYNPKGQLVKSWRLSTSGYKEILWNAESQPSGVYLYTLKAKDFLDTRKLLLLK